MGTITKIYDIPVTTGDDGRSKIDASVINLILYVNSFGFKAKEITEPITDSIVIREFRNRVNGLFFNCLMKGPRPWSNKDALIGEAPEFDICFDKNKIDLNREYIVSLLDELGEINKFTDLSKLKDGQEWTTLRQDLKKLLSLASAAGLINYRINPSNQFDNDPKITLTK